MLGHLGKIAEVMINDTDRPKDGNYLYGAFGRDFGTLDGKRLMVVGLTRNQWSSLVAATGLAEELEVLAKRLHLDFEKEGDRFRARREIARILEPWFATRMLVEIRKIFSKYNITWAPYPQRSRNHRTRPRLLNSEPPFRYGRTAGYWYVPDARLAHRFQRYRAEASHASADIGRACRRDFARYPRLEPSRSRTAT